MTIPITSTNNWALFGTPWEKAFLGHCRNARNTIRVACPFIKLRTIRLLLASIPDNPDRRLALSIITRLNVSDCSSYVHDISALQLLLDNPLLQQATIDVRINNLLHAKLFVFDDAEMIITSSNLTYSGLNRNLEVALLSKSPEQVRAALQFFDSEFSKSTPLTADMIVSIQSSLTTKARTPKDPVDIAAPIMATTGSESNDSDIADYEIAESLNPEATAKLTEYSSHILDNRIQSSQVIYEASTIGGAAAPAAVQQSIALFQQRFRDTFQTPVPTDNETLSILSHQSVRHSLHQEQSARDTAEHLAEAGACVFRLAVAQLLSIKHPHISPDSLNVKRSMIESSDLLVSQMIDRGLCTPLIAPSVALRSHPDSNCRTVGPIRLISKHTAYRILWYLFSTRTWRDVVHHIDSILDIDESYPYESYSDHVYKRLLQRAFQEHGLQSPHYSVVSQAGPDHSTFFNVEVRAGNKTFGAGSGSRKSIAETNAAYNALKSIAPSAKWATHRKKDPELPPSIIWFAESAGAAAVRKTAGVSLSGNIYTKILIPAHRLGTPETMRVIAQVGAEARRLAPFILWSASSNDKLFMLRYSHVQRSTHIMTRLASSPLGRWFDELSKKPLFERLAKTALSDIADAVLGAIVLELGIEACIQMFRVMIPDEKDVSVEDLIPARSRLQQLVDRAVRAKSDQVLTIMTRDLHHKQQSHQPMYEASINVANTALGVAAAPTKKAAIEAACAMALKDPRLQSVLQSLEADREVDDAQAQ